MNTQETNPHWAHALQLAEQAWCISRPNPRVGCVIVSATGKVIGRGSTQAPGQAHAEIMALRAAKQHGHDVAGSTVYVTLEPCSHHGRTPPCCDALIAAKVARVMVALEDPNPKVAGQGIARLRAAGIDVHMAPTTIAQAAHAINAGFLRRMQGGLPWVRTKIAASADGTTALHNGNSQWITADDARADGQNWRSRACAILTGSGTIVCDDPLLNVRNNTCSNQPHLLIADTQVRTPPDARLFTVKQRKVWIYCSETALQNPQIMQRAEKLKQAGADIIPITEDAHKHVNLTELLHDAAQRAVNEVHVEAGATLNGALLQQQLIDELLLYLAPTLLGSGRPIVQIPKLETLNQAHTWHTTHVKPLASGNICWQMQRT